KLDLILVHRQIARHRRHVDRPVLERRDSCRRPAPFGDDADVRVVRAELLREVLQVALHPRCPGDEERLLLRGLLATEERQNGEDEEESASDLHGYTSGTSPSSRTKRWPGSAARK